MIFLKRIYALEKRVTNLERAQCTSTWAFGEIDLTALAHIVEDMQKRQRAADVAASAAPENQSR